MQKETYYYALIRPFSIGTFPLDNFIEFKEKVEGLTTGYRWGFVSYSSPVPLSEIKRFELRVVPPAYFWNLKFSRKFGKHLIQCNVKPGIYSYVANMVEGNGEENPARVEGLIEEVKNGKWEVFGDPKGVLFILKTYEESKGIVNL